ncbi:MAG: DUF1361 domain-containing protein [Armatimonadota bacterium]
MIGFFRGVIWNVFLAAIPVALAYVVYALLDPSRKRVGPLSVVAAFAVGAVWLAFLPNTCYLLTEWRHFLDVMGYTSLPRIWHTNAQAAVTLATYTIFYFCYSGVGMLAFVLAIRPVARVARALGATLWLWAIPLFTLMSIGVYLGLVLRFNSWELAMKPSDIWAAAMAIGNRPALSLFIVAFAGMLWVAYIALDIWVDGFVCRFKGRAPESSR